MRFLGRTGVINESSRDSGELSVEWDIHNFFDMSKKGGDYYESPEFSFSNESSFRRFPDEFWCLSMYSDGMIRYEPSGWVDLSLERKDYGPPMTLQFTLSITGAEGVEKRQERQYTFSNNCMQYIFSGFLPRHVLIDHQSILMPNGILTISCNMKSIKFSNRRGISSYRYLSYPRQIDNESRESSDLSNRSQSLNKQDASIQTDDEFSEENHSLEKHGREKVLEDIGKLLVSGDNSDVTVQVSDVQFKVHRAILSARSPVISAMFRHETAEKATNKIIIRDCEPDIMEEFLQYIYSGSVQSLTKQNVFGLFCIADKYLADDLKQQCLELIPNILCVQTFCETVKLALTYGKSDLLKLATDFASKNISLILCSVEWQNFIRDYPTEANEILIKCFGPRK